MGSELGEEPKPTSLKAYFDELCGYAISIGMTYKEFWEDDIDILLYYVKAEETRQKKRNNEMWLQGAYIYQAIGALAPVLNGMTKEHRASPYLKQPFAITEEERIEQENQKLKRFVAYMDRLASKGGEKNG